MTLFESLYVLGVTLGVMGLVAGWIVVMNFLLKPNEIPKLESEKQ